MEKLTLDYNQLKGLVAKICREISADGWRPDWIVGVSRGGLFPAVMISHYFDIKMQPLKVSLRDHEDCESNLWLAEEAFGYVDNVDRKEIAEYSDPTIRKNILIVDDINDSGATINWIKEDWESSCMGTVAPKIWEEIWGTNVRLACLVENTATKSLIKTSYVGMEINKAEKDVWVGFPYEDWWQQ